MKSNITMMIHNGAGNTDINSMEYIVFACKMRPDFIEVDVRCTSDMIPVLHHDSFITVNTEKIYLKYISYSELSDLKPEILRLDKIVDLIRAHSIGINFDIKELRSVDSVLKLIKEKNISDNIIFTGCRIDEIRKIHNFNADLPVLLNADPAPGGNSDVYIDFMNNTLDIIKDEKFYGLNIDYNDCRPELINLAKSRNIPVMVWTIDNPEDIKRFIKLEVSSITTNEIVLLRELLKNNSEEIDG